MAYLKKFTIYLIAVLNEKKKLISNFLFNQKA